MQFSQPLVQGRLVRRYKRFLADVELSGGRQVTAHCANPGAMLGLARPGSRIWLSGNPNPKAKLDWRWELEEVDGALVGINTSHPNAIVAEALAAGQVPALRGYHEMRREVRYGEGSRIDLLLEDPDRCFVEVKNVHLKRGNRAEFPDSVTARGAKHLDELARQVAAGARAVMFYLVQRSDCDSFAIAADLDPRYAQRFAAARAAGVEVEVWDCALSTGEILLRRPLPLDL